jgi:hypothetical protein
MKFEVLDRRGARVGITCVDPAEITRDSYRTEIKICRIDEAHVHVPRIIARHEDR